MILPNKYENPENNSLVIAADIINKLREKPRDVNMLFQYFSDKIYLNKFLDILTFLYLVDIIQLDNDLIVLKNETTKNIYNANRFI